MDTIEIKLLILLLLFSSSQILFSQENKFGLAVEYSPNFSKLTDEIVDEKFKLSHNALIRISYNTNRIIKPTIGIGFINTGEMEYSEIGGQLGIESVKFIRNYNYIYIPIGLKIIFNKLYLLPELGIGVNISNKTKQITEFTNGEKEKKTRDETLITGEFNKTSIPISLAIGADYSIRTKSFSTGIKGYYGLNQVVKDVQRNNHYFGIGLVLAMNL